MRHNNIEFEDYWLSHTNKIGFEGLPRKIFYGIPVVHLATLGNGKRDFLLQLICLTEAKSSIGK